MEALATQALEQLQEYLIDLWSHPNAVKVGVLALLTGSMIAQVVSIFLVAKWGFVGAWKTTKCGALALSWPVRAGLRRYFARRRRLADEAADAERQEQIRAIEARTPSALGRTILEAMGLPGVNITADGVVGQEILVQGYRTGEDWAVIVAGENVADDLTKADERLICEMANVLHQQQRRQAVAAAQALLSQQVAERRLGRAVGEKRSGAAAAPKPNAGAVPILHGNRI